MGGKGEECANAKDWPAKNNLAFIQILLEHAKDKKMQTSTFKPKVWEEIDSQLEAAVGEQYGVDRLKSKFNRLRKQHREFSELLAHTGVTWDIQSNIVHAVEDVWEMYYMKNKSFKQYRKKGLEHYELLGEIFNNNTATRKLHHASTQKPPTSKEECEIEEEFFSRGMHVDLSNGDNVGDADTSCELRSGLKEGLRRKASSALGDRCPKKEAKTSKMGSCLEAWSLELASKAEANKAPADKYKAQSSKATATSQRFNPYSIEECMDILESMDDLEDTYYNKALEKFIDADWRTMFVKMSIRRRRSWLESLV